MTTCAEVRTILEDWIDGGAPSASRAIITGHLQVCERCAAEEKAIRSLKAGAAALSESIEPARDLWPRIEAGLGPNPRSAGAGRTEDGSRRVRPRVRAAWFPRPILVAAAVAAVVLGIAFMWRATSSPPASGIVTKSEPGGSAPDRGKMPASSGGTAPSGISAARGPAGPPGIRPETDLGAASASPPGMGGAELAFLEARQQLRSALYERRDSLSPETLKTVDRELKVIEDAIVVIRGAVARDPGNRELQQMFLAARQREVALLRHMTQTADLKSR